MSPLWNLIFSRCPFLSWTNNIFGNNYVMEKGIKNFRGSYKNNQKYLKVAMESLTLAGSVSTRAPCWSTSCLTWSPPCLGRSNSLSHSGIFVNEEERWREKWKVNWKVLAFCIMRVKCQSNHDRIIKSCWLLMSNSKALYLLIASITFNTARLENKSRLFISDPVVAISDAK